MPLDLGTALLAPSIPRGWSANCVRIERAAPDLGLGAAATLTAQAVPHVGYRHVRVDDPQTARRLTGEAGATAGWHVSHELLLVHTGAPVGEPAATAIREGSSEEVLGLLREWYAESPENTGATLDDLCEMARREFAANRTEHLVAGPAGRPAAMASVFYDEHVAQVENVYVRSGARGTGLGRAVVVAATRAALARRPDVLFIVADADDWPQRLYRAAGFADAHRTVLLHLAA